MGLGLGAIALAGCRVVPPSVAERDALHAEVRATIARFEAEEARMGLLFDTAYAYAVFPTVRKGGVGIGGAHGRGEVFEQQEMIGYCDLAQGTIGFQLGGQAYSEVIFFQNEWALSKFKTGQLAIAAQASAVSAASGASADAAYQQGVAVFTMARGGLMAEASIGGQRFRFVPDSIPDPADGS